MLPFFDSLRDLGFSSLVIRLLITVVCGTAIGLERSAKNRPAGFRTHILVCLSGAVAAITGHYLVLGLHLPADLTRLSGQVITGLGFIGMGTIIVTKKMSIKGLTTAAGLWTTGVIGIAVGSGFYEGGLLGTAFVLITETSLTRFGIRIKHTPEAVFEVLYRDKTSLDNVLRFCKDKRMMIKNLRIHSIEGPEMLYRAEISLRFSGDVNSFLEQVRSMPGIQSATLREAS